MHPGPVRGDTRGMRTAALALVLLAGCASTPKPGVLSRGPAWLRADGDAPSLSGRHVVFVAGFLNEVIPGYFVDNAEAARELGASTSTLFPKSSGSIDDDVQLIGGEVARHPDTPVVLFGHSKGGAAVLLTVLEHPELVLSGRVEAVVVVQGAVGGSPLADVLSRVTALRNPGVRSLSTEGARDAFDTALARLRAEHDEAERATLFSHIFYVRSAQADTQAAAELAPTHAVLRAKGDNDGLVATKDMRLDEGVDLGVLDADHAALTVSSFLAVSSRDERRQFTRVLFQEVGRRLGWGPRGAP